MAQNFKENFRDKSRDDFHKHLLTLGINASLSERGALEEKLLNPWHRRSLGVIKINSDSPIKYINIMK